MTVTAIEESTRNFQSSFKVKEPTGKEAWRHGGIVWNWKSSTANVGVTKKEGGTTKHFGISKNTELIGSTKKMESNTSTLENVKTTVLGELQIEGI